MNTAFLSRLPQEIQILSVVILTLFLVMNLWAIVGWISENNRLKRLHKTIATVDPINPAERRHGLSLSAYTTLLEAMAGTERASWWQTLQASVVEYPVETAARLEPRIFVSTVVDRIASIERMVGTPSWQRFYKLLPGVTTSLGLFGTFLALLLGLSQVTVVGETVIGTDALINNLSGKFFTSVGAIALSVLAVILEGVIQTSVKKSWRKVVDALDDRLPLLTTGRVLIDLRSNSVAQTEHLSELHTTFALEIGNVFREQVGPAMAQQVTTSMAQELGSGLTPLLTQVGETLKGLTATVARLESSKQESVVGEVKMLVASITETLQTTLGSMGTQFREALGSSTQHEFSNLGRMLEGSTGALHDMTTSFRALESGLQAVVANAQQATVNQMESGTAQTERLQNMVEALMGRLQDTASENVTAVGDALSRAVAGLSQQMTELGTELATSVRASSHETNIASQAALHQAEEWTKQTGAQLGQVLASLEAKAGLLDSASQRVAEARLALEQGLRGSVGALEAMNSAAANVRGYTEGLAVAQTKSAAGHEAQQRLVEHTRDLFGQVTTMTSAHNDLLERHRSMLGQYQASLASLDSDLQRVLGVIGEEMNKYSAAMQRSFEAVVATSNKYIPEFTEAIKDGTGEVRDGFEELADALERATKRLAPGDPG